MVTWIFLCLLSLVIILLLWVLFVPVYILIESERNLYQIRQAGTVSISFHPDKKPLFRFSIFGFPIPTGGKDRSGKKKKDKKKKDKKSGPPFQRSGHAWLYLIKGLIKSFRVSFFRASIDTDDVVLNAQLVPVAMLLSRGPVNISTNFQGVNYLSLEIRLRLNKVAWAFIRFLTKK